jgi:hypothetical protein
MTRGFANKCYYTFKKLVGFLRTTGSEYVIHKLISLNQPARTQILQNNLRMQRERINW